MSYLIWIKCIIIRAIKFAQNFAKSLRQHSSAAEIWRYEDYFWWLSYGTYRDDNCAVQSTLCPYFAIVISSFSPPHCQPATRNLIKGQTQTPIGRDTLLLFGVVECRFPPKLRSNTRTCITYLYLWQRLNYRLCVSLFAVVVIVRVDRLLLPPHRRRWFEFNMQIQYLFSSSIRIRFVLFGLACHKAQPTIAHILQSFIYHAAASSSSSSHSVVAGNVFAAVTILA